MTASKKNNKSRNLVMFAICIALLAGFVGCMVLGIRAGAYGCTAMLGLTTMVYAIYQEWDTARLLGVLSFTAYLFSSAI